LLIMEEFQRRPCFNDFGKKYLPKILLGIAGLSAGLCC